MDPSTLQETDIVHRDYRLLFRLGSGSFGAVYAAQHTPSELLVAIKVVRASECDWIWTRGARDPIPLEYAALRRLEGHQGILRAHHFLCDRDLVYMVMEPHGQSWTKVDGGHTVHQYADPGLFVPGDLGTAMRQQTLTMSEAGIWDVFSQIVSAVVHMHSKRIAHRDLKPENILIDRSGLIKLADFGLASYAIGSRKYDDKYVGTRYYAAPEVCLAPNPYQVFPADIFALGTILWELVQLPGGPRCYEENFPVVTVQTPPPTALWPCSERWASCWRLLSACCRENPDRRPSAHDIKRTRWFIFNRLLRASPPPFDV